MKRRTTSTLFLADFWPNFVDLLSSLLLLFIFLAFYQFFSRYDLWQGLIIKSKQGQLLNEFQKEFPNEMKTSLITITIDGNLQRISYSDKLLFNSGAVALKDHSYLDRSAKILRKLDTGIFKKIQVEGHTDSVHISPTSKLYLEQGVKDNWDLSAARAVEVVRHLQTYFQINPELLSATGYSWHQAPSNPRWRDWERNRKIEIVLVYSMQDLHEIELGEKVQ